MSTENPKDANSGWNGNKTPPGTKEEIKPKRWTVMIYMAGDNNLSEECVYNLTEAKEALTENSEDKLAVLAQFDPAGLRAETRRFHLRPKTLPNHEELTDDRTGWRAHETNTGEANTLLEFLRWGISEHPAEHYMVVLVGHGSGTNDDYLLRDDNPANALSIDGMRYVFDQLTADGQTIDILGFDTCLMNMAEVCFELLRTSVTYLVGSEGYAPNTGWPYKKILEQIIYNIEKDPEWLAKQITREYQAFYLPYISGGISVDQSVLDVKKIDEVKRKMFSLVGALMADLDDKSDSFDLKKNAMVLAHWDAQSYNGEAFVDLYDFCQQLIIRYQEFKITSGVIDKCKDVRDAIKKMVSHTHLAGIAFQFSYGLSIYFPWAVVLPSYRNLAFPKETGWLDYLMRYHSVTRRLGRKSVEAPQQAREPESPYRATPDTNKGRDGRVQSMRNPPSEEYNDGFDDPVDILLNAPPKDRVPTTPPPERAVAAKANTNTRKEAETKTENKVIQDVAG